MSKFYAIFKGNGRDSVLGKYDNEHDAIECAVKKVDELYSSEKEQARLALQQRGYYCINWSCNEVCVEEKDK